jgi:V8-like Glu-specific endopeptidase
MTRSPRSLLNTRATRLIAVLLLAVFGLSGVGSARASNTGASTPAPRGQSTRGGLMRSPAQPEIAAQRTLTAEEMRAAKPYPTPKTSLKRASGAAATQVLGTPGTVKGQTPKINARSSKGGPTTQSIPVDPYTYLYYPYSTVGKLFFFQYGIEYVCSASLVKGHAIWTAGHCAHAGNGDPDGWSYGGIFVPQYYDTDAPLGVCYVTDWITPSDWYYNGLPDGLDYDYAGGNVSCDLEDITDYTGYLGLAWNQSYRNFWRAIGYPAGEPFTGEIQIECASGRKGVGIGTPETFGIKCDMTGGSSGGPWLLYGAYVNGNTSYFDSDYPDLLFSPHLDTLARTLWGLLDS